MGQILIDGGEFLIIGIATKALCCAPHVDWSAGFRLNDRDYLVVDRWPCVPARHFVPSSQSCWLAFSGGNIVIRNMAGVSSRPNGPGTLWLIAGRLLRYSTMARTSDFVSPAYARHGMMGARMRPSGLTPV